MTRTTLPPIVLVIVLLLLAYQPAHAHRMRVFAYESGGVVHTEVKFNSGRAARNVAVFVEDENSSQLLTGTTDDNGTFSFPLPEKVRETPTNLTIIADTGDGHRGTWVLEAEEYAASPATSTTPASPATSTLQPEKQQQDTGSAEKIDKENLDETIRRVVAAELAPVKKMLAQQRQRSLSFQDILGGIGYLIGLAGIAAYVQSRKTNTNGGNK